MPKVTHDPVLPPINQRQTVPQSQSQCSVTHPQTNERCARPAGHAGDHQLSPFVEDAETRPIPGRARGLLAPQPSAHQVTQEILAAAGAIPDPDSSPTPADWQPDPAQPKNSKRDVDQSRRFDTTQLKESGHGYTVHRDYGAHFFRWGFAKRFIKLDSFVLDVGCGQDQPLARVLSHNAGNVPAMMVACDYNRIRNPFNAAWLRTLDQFDFTTRWQECLNLLPDVQGWDRKFDIITNFEVIEHMHSADAARLLGGFKQCLAKNGLLLLSTPVFNGRAAANHLHEWTIPELQAAIEAAGLRVQRRFGTFMNYPVARKVLSPHDLLALERLCEFYDGDVASCFFAPSYPDHARNNVWLIRHPEAL